MPHSSSADAPLKPFLRLAAVAFLAGFVGYLLAVAAMVRPASGDGSVAAFTQAQAGEAASRDI